MTAKTFTEILTDMLGKVAARTPLTNFNVGSVLRTLFEIFSGAVAELYAFVVIALKQGFLDTATGFWLDLKAKEYGLTRKPATFTEGGVVFGRNAARSANVSIPAGTIVATLKDAAGREYRYVTQTEVVLQANQTEVPASVKAESAGAAWNVGADAIRKLTVYISGIDFVRNSATWITAEGTDQESDDELRRRCFLAWEELARGGTRDAYISWALGVNGVKNVYVNDNFPRGQGTVDVYILSASGVPTSALIAQTQSVVDQNKPITANALVLAPIVRDVVIDAVLTPRRFANTQTIEAEVRKRMDAYFNPSGNPDYTWLEPLGIGRDVVTNQIVEIVMSVPGVYNVMLNAPVADIPVAPEEFPRLAAFIISFSPEAEL